MASKSRFLEELISGKLTPTTNIIDVIWGSYQPQQLNTISSSILDSLTNNTTVLSDGDAWINALDVYEKNTDHTVRDTTITGINQITTELKALPIVKPKNYNMFDGTSGFDGYHLPANYVICKLEVEKGTNRYTIPVLFPKSISRSLSASFAKQNPIGSSKAVMAFAYTDSETIPFAFDCLSEYLPSGYTSMTKYIDDILSVLKPSYSGSVVHEPRVTITMADLSYKCVCTSASVEYDMLFDGGLDTSGNTTFAHAMVSLNLTRID